MGCRLTRTESTELCEQSKKEDEKQGHVSNGQTALLRRDTPTAQALDLPRNGCPSNSLLVSKPIGEVESASQADFFRMLDAKIAHGADLDSENED
ncbi:hypothetical protein GCK32_013134 [Trichostrongylus colubriformis]|uniref:Uncharacterized protein n=1 Tax=Trichostrongylus colubriformis TaxID=6319 RepID=A0AAN8FIJ1_TRICO